MARYKTTVFGLIKLAKPAQWTKSLGNMLLGFALATNFLGFNLALFGLGFLAVGPMLWGGLYSLNDWTDWQKDKLHTVKKNRPIPSGEVSPRAALMFSIILIGLAIATGFFLNNFLFLLCLGAMLANQLAYTLKPLELKKKPLVDLISGSLVNPFFRFYSGWVLVAPAFNAPIEILVFVLALQFGGYTLYRLASAEHDRQMNYRSSVAVFGEKKIKALAYAGIALGCTAFLAAIFNGVLAPKFLLLGLLLLLAVPYYRKAVSKPKEMDLRKLYRIIYAHYALFIIGFFILRYFV